MGIRVLACYQTPVYRSWRIGHVDTERGFSGGEVQVFLLLEGLRRWGHHVVLFCPPESRCAEEAQRRGIEHAPIPMRNDIDWRAFSRLAQAFRSRQLDLVHLHTGRANWLGGLAAWRSSIPAVSTRRMERVVKHNWRNGMVYGRFLRRIVSISPAVSDCLRAGDVDPEHIVMIPEAVDPARIRPVKPAEQVRAELGAQPGDCVLLAMAALVPRKGIDVLVEAMAKAAAAGWRPPLWIAGEGSARKSLEARSAELGLDRQIRFLGPRDDAADLYAACDVFVMPSRKEGLGVAALEAMAAGRPVVCSAIGGLAFSVEHERTGLHVPPDDASALCESLLRLGHDEPLRRRLGAEGPRRIEEEFSVEKMVQSHLQLYAAILSESTEPADPRELH